jgi:hypothetical protein
VRDLAAQCLWCAALRKARDLAVWLGRDVIVMLCYVMFAVKVAVERPGSHIPIGLFAFYRGSPLPRSGRGPASAGVARVRARAARLVDFAFSVRGDFAFAGSHLDLPCIPRTASSASCIVYGSARRPAASAPRPDTSTRDGMPDGCRTVDHPIGIARPGRRTTAPRTRHTAPPQPANIPSATHL